MPKTSQELALELLADPPPNQQALMVASLSESLARQGVSAALDANKHLDFGDLMEAKRLLGLSQGFHRAAQQALLLAKHV